MNERDLQEELKRGVYVDRPLLKAIKLKCMDCCGGSWEEVKACQCTSDCFLHPYRLGKNPFKKHALTEDQKQVLRDRLKKMREGK